ncbi:DUF4167 domain-containing protein [uncultured Jannaschia sp.]|uniref:DUF4167 domain-containing protein n=1 Tax=uncultured Jannaschia sp. TaxID=293347 RepID=UPI0026284FAC|nr:DUF4167 domain-containing protein [uncultured Jannaschia sp.]
MRSSKSRSRNKNRNNRPQGGNIVNRVFDSSGPEGKVRGTPAQIIEKYNQLARDAQLSGDRVAVENFQQHAEHYTRILAAAQKEMDARQQQNQQNQGGQNGQQGGQQNGQGGGNGNQNGGGQQVGQQNGGQPQQNNQGGQDGPPNEGGPKRRSRNRRDRDDRNSDDRRDDRGGNDRDGVGDQAGDTHERSAPETTEAPRAEPVATEAAVPAQGGPEAAPEDKPKRSRVRKKAPAPESEATPQD